MEMQHRETGTNHADTYHGAGYQGNRCSYRHLFGGTLVGGNPVKGGLPLFESLQPNSPSGGFVPICCHEIQGHTLVGQLIPNGDGTAALLGSSKPPAPSSCSSTILIVMQI
ncbi:unnamed protein product [Pleuronectes platessa]|uniref:Uncharacterized protein n=1 Tax=Pleuronectes platessa TaxID=8262 RepID=A0A9N7V926_PLEPL|nr:unnamed protein product [Pleuronectes platessa]